MGLPWWLSGKESACGCRRYGSIPDLGGSHMPRSNQAHMLQLLSLCSRAHVPQLPKPVLHKRSHHNEKPTRCNWGAAPALLTTTREKPMERRRPRTAKNKIF